MAIVRYPHLALRERMWELRDNLTVYDAAFVVLSEILDVPLVTVDARIAGTPGHHARVEVF
jgi:predicted nucleic acid-binding protein